MATLTRQQLIDVIDQYIYANGQQRITAPQLHEILLEIANAFEMVGGGSASGIDEVLEEGSTVSDGREITNSFGGKIQLAVNPLTIFSEAPEPDAYKYVGINVAESPYIGQVYSDKTKTVIGNIKTTDLSKTLFSILPGSDEVYAGTIYNVLEREEGDEDAGMGSGPGRGPGLRGSEPFDFMRGVTSIYISEDINAMHTVSEKGVGSYMMDNTAGSSSTIKLTGSAVETNTSEAGVETTQLISSGGIISTIEGEDITTSNNITLASSVTKVESGDQLFSHTVGLDGIITEVHEGDDAFTQSVQWHAGLNLTVEDTNSALHVGNLSSQHTSSVTNKVTEEYSSSTQTSAAIVNKLFNEDEVELAKISMEPFLTYMSLFDPQTEVTDILFLDPQENQGGATFTSYKTGSSGSVNVRPSITTITSSEGANTAIITATSGNVNIAVASGGTNSYIDQSVDAIEISADDGVISLNAATITLNGDLNFMKTGAEIITTDGSESVFVIPHGLGLTPGSFALTFSDGSNPEFRNSVRTVDATQISITCPSPPTAGSITVYWQVFR